MSSSLFTGERLMTENAVVQGGRKQQQFLDAHTSSCENVLLKRHGGAAGVLSDASEALNDFAVSWEGALDEQLLLSQAWRIQERLLLETWRLQEGVLPRFGRCLELFIRVLWQERLVSTAPVDQRAKRVVPGFAAPAKRAARLHQDDGDQCASLY